MTGITGLFFSNLYLLKQSTNYFANESILNPFTHTWSLDVEEQFYLLFPFFIWFSGFSRKKYFDENIFLYLENDDICLRARNNNQKIYI